MQTVKNSSLINEHNRYDYMSWFTNISSCIWLKKITNILKNTIDDENDTNRCINILQEQVKIISSYKITNIERYRDIYDEYTSKYLNDSIGAVEQFISDNKTDEIFKYFKVKYIGNKRQKNQRGNKEPKNLIMDFNSDYFVKITGRYEDIPLYPTCYCHYFIIAFLLDIIASAEITLPQYERNNSFYCSFYKTLHENLNSSVLTGLEAFAEFKLNYLYTSLYDELPYLTSLSKDKLIFYFTPANKSFDATIKEYSLITQMFVKYRNAWNENDIGRIIPNPTDKSGQYRIKSQDVVYINSDPEHDEDKRRFSKLRIKEGSNPNNMIVYITLSGQRIINRIFDSSSNVKNNIKTHEIIDYIPSTANMIAFILWCILNSAEIGDKNSPIQTYHKYIREYLEEKGQRQTRNLITKTAVPIILSSKTKEEQESFINNHFSEKQSKQKALVRANINKINIIKQQESHNNSKTFLQTFIKELKDDYNW